MLAAKLNMHASDVCRFGVESKLYPNLTASLLRLQLVKSCRCTAVHNRAGKEYSTGVKQTARQCAHPF